MPYNIKLETEIQKLGFKRKWLSDKSGYWFEKRVKSKDFKICFVVNSDREIFYMDVLTYNVSYKGELSKNTEETIAKFKCDIKTIKQTLKKYK